MSKTEETAQLDEPAQDDKNAVKRSKILGHAGKGVKKIKQKLNHITVIYFPPSGVPYEEEVEPDMDLSFSIVPGESHVIVAGSVWTRSDGKACTMARHGITQTLDARTLAGDTICPPSVAHHIINNNQIRQFDDISKRRNLWKQGSTYAYIAMGIIALLLFFWNIKTIGSGLGDLEDAMRMFTDSVADAGSSSGTGSSSGHNNIAPGGA